MNDDFGESDLEDLRELQNLYNRKNSDYADALRFQMFGAEAIIDGKDEDVNKLTIAPNALHVIRTDDNAAEKGKQATIQRLEYSMGNAEAANNYLDRIDKDMRDMLDMPNIKDLNNIPSAKTMKYMYNDLIARCEEKWSDWEPTFKNLINFVIETSKYSYGSIFKSEWLGISYTLLFKHNYPIPEDMDDKKTLAMKEIQSNVRSHKSYIKDFSDAEDADGEYEEIVQEISDITAAENEQFQTGS